MKKPLLIRDILPQALKNEGIDRKIALCDLQNHWEALVGPLLSRKSFPTALYGKRLIVGVAGSVWSQELEYLKLSFLQKIRKKFPYIPTEEVRFQIATKGFK